MTSQRRRPEVQILEKGNILFFYRPKKGVSRPQNPDDLERAYLMLLPDDQRRHKNRVLNVAHGVFPAVVPGNALPEERDWAFVQDVGADPKTLLGDLEESAPEQPAASGQRARPWARIAGEGQYAILRHEGHTHLAYRLRQPRRIGEVQEELQIKPEASYILSVKEPFVPSEIAPKQKPRYPEDLRAKFDGHKFIPAEPTDFLDYQWTQVLLIGSRTNVAQELGIELAAEAENKAERAVFDLLKKEEQEAERQGVSLLEPLEKGRWA